MEEPHKFSETRTTIKGEIDTGVLKTQLELTISATVCNLEMHLVLDNVLFCIWKFCATTVTRLGGLERGNYSGLPRMTLA
jgi:hypothetical protein